MKTKAIIIIFLCTILIEANGQKKIQITGRVMDSFRNPVEGTLVFVDNTHKGRFTDENGFYKIKAKPDAKMIRIKSFTGQSAELPVNGQMKIDFCLPGVFTAVRQPETKVKIGNDKVNSGYNLKYWFKTPFTHDRMVNMKPQNYNRLMYNE